MADLSKQKTEDLVKTLTERREALRKFRFAETGSRMRNVREGRTLRKEIAQILTEINARTLAVEK